MSGGRAYEHPTSGPRTIGRGCSSSSPILPTPQAADGMGGHLTRSGSRSHELLLPGVAKAYGEGRLNEDAPCLPTPTASDGEKDRNNPSQARRKSPPLSAISAHFPETDEPTIFLTDKWGVPLCQTCSEALRDRLGSWSCPDPNVCGNQNDPFPPDDWFRDDVQIKFLDRGRADDLLVLPTPRTTDSHGPGHHGQGGPDLRTAISYLPTPNAADGNGGRYNATGHQSSLPGTAREVGNWGKYAPAIHRWEQVTRPAPAPTESNSNGRPRLAAAFAEWMMGLPAGWVTDPAIGISRADQLKAIGNGVCPPQAVAALHQLLAMEAAGA